MNARTNFCIWFLAVIVVDAKVEDSNLFAQSFDQLNKFLAVANEFLCFSCRSDGIYGVGLRFNVQWDLANENAKDV